MQPLFDAFQKTQIMWLHLPAGSAITSPGTRLVLSTAIQRPSRLASQLPVESVSSRMRRWFCRLMRMFSNPEATTTPASTPPTISQLLQIHVL